MATRLKALLRQRHWQSHATFKREYERTASAIGIKSDAPQRTQLHRWTSGDLKGLPYADHCLVLEAMLPGWTIEQLLEPVDDEAVPTSPATVSGPNLLDAMRASVGAPTPAVSAWGVPRRQSSHREMVVAAPSADIAVSMEDELARRLIALQKTMRLSDADMQNLAELAGQIVHLSSTIDIRIARNGHAVVRYTHQILNLSGEPIKRVARDAWFKYTHAPITIEAQPLDERKVMIQRLHDSTSMSKFACQFAPAIQPGEVGYFAYTVHGGHFLDEFYWREQIIRHTRHLTIGVQHEGASLLRCSAIEELIDGSEVFATDDIVWDNEGEGFSMTVSRDYLAPGQNLTLRWDANAATA